MYPVYNSSPKMCEGKCTHFRIHWKSKKNWTGQNISDGKDIKWSCQGIKKQHVLFCMWRVSLAMRLETVDLYACNAQVWFLLGEISQGSPDRF